MNLEGKRIIISRTDSIGDVMLTLPLCHWVKQQSSSAHVIFLGKSYTRAIVEPYQSVNQFEDWAEYEGKSERDQLSWIKALKADIIIHVFPNKQIATLAKKANIAHRIGTSHRLYHLLTCNHRLNFTRKNSDLHEAQLNFELLRPFGLNAVPTLDELNVATLDFKPEDIPLPTEFATLNNYVILHPKSQGSALEWPMESYIRLARQLVESGRKVVFTGTENEGALFRDQLPKVNGIIDSTGKLTLQQLIILIRKAQALIACSTGPLHIAGYSGIRTVGLFSPKRPIHPGRWKALGPNVKILQSSENEVDRLDSISVESAFKALTS